MAARSRCLPSTVTHQKFGTRVEADAVPICGPLFSPADADMALRSLEGTIYRVRTDTLRSNSGLFNTMLSLPQDETQHDPAVIKPIPKAILDVYENDFPLGTLLCLMSGIPVLKWETIDAFECVLHLAEKWDTPGPIDFLRSALTAHRFMEHYPLRCYRLATHFNWGTEAKLASRHSLALDIFNPIHRDALDRLSSKDLLSLFDLHRQRQIMFRGFLNCPERFVAGNSPPYYCRRCGITELDDSPWREFKNRMFLEMETRPMGDALKAGLGGGGDAAGWPEARACWEARCPREGCGALGYDRFMTLRQIEACVALLPQTVEWED